MAADGAASHTFQGLNNEADMAAFAAYIYAGRADRAQEVLHAVKTYSYGLGRGGLAGNEDSGGEASWFVWACLGLFPLSGLPVVLIGLPSFRSVALRVSPVHDALGARRTLTIRRVGHGRYIQNGSLDGMPLCGRSWLWVHEVQAGGTLELRMDRIAAPLWGSVLPPSFGPEPPEKAATAVEHAPQPTASTGACAADEGRGHVTAQPAAALGAGFVLGLVGAVAGLLGLAALLVTLVRRWAHARRAALPRVTMLAMDTLSVTPIDGATDV